MAFYMLRKHQYIATPMPTLSLALLFSVAFVAEISAVTPPIDGIFSVYTKYGIAGLSLLVSLGLIWLVGKLFNQLMERSKEDLEIRKTEAKNSAELVETLKNLVHELRQRTVLIQPNSNDQTPLGLRDHD